MQSKRIAILMVFGSLFVSLVLLVRNQQHKANPTVAPPSPTKPSPVSQPTTSSSKTDISLLIRAVQQAPKDPQRHWDLVEAYQTNQDWKEARKQLLEIITLEPKSPKALLALASLDFSEKNLLAAETTYRTITQKWKNSDEAWAGLAGALFHEKRYLEASDAARNAVRLSPNNSAHHAVLGTALMEAALQFPNRSEFKLQLAEARHELESILSNWNQKGEITYRLGRLCLTQRDYHSAISYYTQAQTLLPDRASVTFSLAGSYIASGDRTTGRKVLEEGLKKFPNEAALYDMMGQMLQQSKETNALPLALQMFEKAVQLSPKTGRFLERYGVACLRANRLEEARKLFEQSATLNPNRAYPYQQLALIYNRLGRPKRAKEASQIAQDLVRDAQQLKQFQNLSALHPESVGLHLILADRYRDLGMRGPSRDQYLMVLQLEQKNQRALEGIKALGAVP